MSGTNDTPRSAVGLVSGAFKLYRRHPLLFLYLAAGVIVPYETIVLAVTGAGPLAQSSLGLGISFLLTQIDWLLIAPLVSALHVHAVADIREGRQPRLGPVARRGLTVLPVVVAATIISALGTIAGFFALVIPGVILLLRWIVVAQAAAIEPEGWVTALRRSARLTSGNYGHVLLFVLCVGVIVSAPTLLIGLGFGHDSTDAASFLVGLIVEVLTASFSALATAMLYYDLRAREEAPVVEAPETRSVESEAPQTEHSPDPRTYSDEDRPQGWYVDPASPNRMRYWKDGDPPGWEGTTRTPRRLRRAWRADGRGG